MPKFNLDEDETLSEPIEIIIEGKTFIVSKITDKTFRKISEIESIGEQFAFLTKAKMSVVSNLNLAKVAKALRYIMETIIGTATGMDFKQLVTLAAKKEKRDEETEVKND